MSKQTIGWREWVSLPNLGLRKLKAKVDTGARTSSLHAYFLEPFEQDGQPKIRFGVHPLQGRTDIKVICEADILDKRDVMDSGGHRELRYVILTHISFLKEVYPIEVTLTNRDTMRFRFLLGRTAMRGKFQVDPSRSFLAGRILKKKDCLSEDIEKIKEGTK